MKSFTAQQDSTAVYINICLRRFRRAWQLSRGSSSSLTRSIDTEDFCLGPRQPQQFQWVGIATEGDNRWLAPQKALKQLTISTVPNRLWPGVCPNSSAAHQQSVTDRISRPLCASGLLTSFRSHDARRNADAVVIAHHIDIVEEIDRGRGGVGGELCRRPEFRPAQSLQKIRAGTVIPGRGRYSARARKHRQISSASHPSLCASCPPVRVVAGARSHRRPSGGRR